MLDQIWIDKDNLQICAQERNKFILFTFILVKNQKGQEFSWKINKSYQDFQKLNDTLVKIKDAVEITNNFPRKRHFNKETGEKQLEILARYLRILLSSSVKCIEITEFLEISIMSFSGDNKLKEGYVYKYGSARRTNQKRCFNCCSKIFGMKKRWLRILPTGIEFRASNISKQVEEVINYCKDFKVKSGSKDTNFADGVKIITPQHNYILRAENLQKRDEWIEAINMGYRESEFCLFQVRFNSSFIIREKNEAKYYIDGEDYFHDVFTHLISAKTIVCISDWWMSPDLYLKRPASLYPDSQIVEVLGSLADRGVQVYVLLYKEITFTLTLNSLYTKRALTKRHKNIKVLRHPSVSIRGGEFLWSHHSKLICIDNHIAFLGGLDICYGRWDTQKHMLGDIDSQIWPGIDYSNVRVSDFVKVDKWEKDSIDRKTIPRMPWHDVCVSLSGLVVKDLWNHFMEVWNHITKDITGNRKSQELIPLPDNTLFQRIKSGLQDVIIKANNDIQDKSNFNGLDSNSKKDNYEDDLNRITSTFYNDRRRVTTEPIEIKKIDSTGSAKFNFIGMMRIFLEKRILDPYPNALRLQRSEDIDFEEMRKAEELDEFETNQSLQTANPDNFLRKLQKRGSSEFFIDNNGRMECQVLRSAGSWSLGREISEESIHSAYLQLIFDAKHFIYIENQFFISRSAGKPVINSISEALIKRIEMAIDLDEKFLVIVVLPLLPAFEGSVDDPSAAVLRVQLHWEYRTISRGKKSIYSRLREKTPNPEKYIRFFSLRTHEIISETPVTEMIYIHSKLLIVDDTTVVIGSANVNDRSMNGDRDAELAVVIKDSEKIYSVMNQQEVKVSRFAYNFRMNLFKEHSGCQDEEVLKDPLSEEFFKVWDKRAKKNTRCYRKVFRCYPDDRISNLNMIKEYMQRAEIDKYPTYSKKIKGNIVQFPLEFLSEENLKISVTKKEFLLPDVTFV